MKKTTINLVIMLFMSIIMLAQQKNQVGISPGKDIVIANKNYSTIIGNIEVSED